MEKAREKKKVGIKKKVGRTTRWETGQNEIRKRSGGEREEKSRQKSKGRKDIKEKERVKS